MQRFIPRDPPPWPYAGLIAVLAVAVAWLVRAVLLPVVADQAPYATFFAAVIVAGTFGGWKSGGLAAVLGGLAGNISFVGGDGGLALQGEAGAALMLYLAVAALLVLLIHALTGSLRRERELNDHLVTVSAESRHRIKNLLAVAQALVQQTGRATSSIEEFQDKVLDRLQALSRAQDLLFEGGEDTVRLRSVVGEILRPFALDDRLAQPSGGPQAVISADSAVALALLLNELATNAAKYGALSTRHGRLRLGWDLDDGQAVLVWKEIDGPAVTPPEKLGFGSRLFEQVLPGASQAASLSFEPDGVRCEIRIALAGGA